MIQYRLVVIKAIMQTKNVLLPRRFDFESIHEFVAAPIDANGLPLADKVVFDFDALNWIDGCGLTVFVNMIEWLSLNGVVIQYVNYNRECESLRYLDDCGFFEEYVGRKLRHYAKIRNTTQPIKKISYSDSHQWFEFNLTPWLVARLNITRTSFAEIISSIKEIFNNIKDHSTQEIGCVHVQFYPNLNEISVAISDFGVGIPESLSRLHTFDNDGEAILKAAKDGVSAQSLPSNRGAGLNILTNYVATRNGGKVSIYSAEGAAMFWPSKDGHMNCKCWTIKGHYPGTLVHIRLRTDTIEVVPDEREDLEW